MNHHNDNQKNEDSNINKQIEILNNVNHHSKDTNNLANTKKAQNKYNPNANPKNKIHSYSKNNNNNSHHIAHQSILTDDYNSQIPIITDNPIQEPHSINAINISSNSQTHNNPKNQMNYQGYHQNINSQKMSDKNNDNTLDVNSNLDNIYGLGDYTDTQNRNESNSHQQNFDNNKLQNSNGTNVSNFVNNTINMPQINRNIIQNDQSSNSSSNNNADSLAINIENDQTKNYYENLHDLDRGKELYALSGLTPLPTDLYLSIGPLLNQITSIIESFIQTIWVSKAIGKEGMSAISSYMPFENISRAFGLTAACSGSNAVSGLIATNKSDKEEGSQVISDLLRVCLIIGIIIPAILCPLVEKAVKWFGASEQVVKLGFNYILPILICTFFTCIYLGITGFLEGEGRPILYTVITISTTLINIAFLCPLFLFGFNTGIVGAGLAEGLSHAISGTVLFTLYFTGAFTIKPKFNHLFKKFSPLTGSALKACLSQGTANLALCIPAILIRKLLGKLSIDEEDYTNSVTGFHAVTRYTQIVDKIIIAFVTGYLPAASYAYSTKDYKRWLFLTLHVNWLCFAWGSFTSILTFAIPKHLTEVFLKENNYVSIAAPMIKIANSGGFFAFAEYTVGNMLRSLKMGLMAAIMGTLVNIIAIFGFSLLLYHTNKKNPERLMYAYPCSNLFGLVVAGAFIAYPAYKLYKEWKFFEENSIENNNDEEADKQSRPLPRIEVANVDTMI